MKMLGCWCWIFFCVLVWVFFVSVVSLVWCSGCWRFFILSVNVVMRMSCCCVVVSCLRSRGNVLVFGRFVGWWSVVNCWCGWMLSWLVFICNCFGMVFVVFWFGLSVCVMIFGIVLNVCFVLVLIVCVVFFICCWWMFEGVNCLLLGVCVGFWCW